MILGDWNAVVGSRLDETEKASHGGYALEIQRNDRGAKLLAWASSRNVRVQNTCFRKWPDKLVTHVRGESKRQIDYIMTRNAPWLQMLDVEVDPGLVVVSDHRPLKAKMRMDTSTWPGHVGNVWDELQN